MAVDYNGNALSWNGTTWSAPTSVDPPALNGGPGLTGISCPSSSFCMAVDDYGNALSWNGSTWSAPQAVDSGTPLAGISCAAVGSCLAVDANGNFLSFGNGTWSPVITPNPATGDFTAVSCPATTLCIAFSETSGTNSYATLIHYTNGAWHTSTPQWVDASAGYVTGVSCPSSTFCMAVDGKGDALSWNGSSWGEVLHVDGSGSTGIDAVSCPSASFCVAVDQAGYVLYWNGSTWSTPVLLPWGSGGSMGDPTALSCPSSSFCAVVDGSGFASTFDGTSWSTPVLIDGVTAQNYVKITSVSCPSSTFCMAVDEAGNALTWNGTRWSAPVLIDGTSSGGVYELSAVSCPSSTFCMAADKGGGVLDWNGSSWSARSPVDANADITSVSCPTASECQAVDSSGDALAYGGSGWSTPTSVDPNGGGFTGLSCPSSTFCMAVDFAGNFLAWNGTAWGQPQPVDSALLPTLTSVSCPSSTFCMAVDGQGDAFTYVPASSAPPTLLAYTSTSPTRICDTRPGNPSGLSGLAAQCNGHPLASGSVLTIDMPESVPADAGAVVLNVTATEAQSPGYLTVYPAGNPSPPLASNLNFTSHQTVANLVTVALGSSDGVPAVDVFYGPSGAGTVDVVVDLEGWYAPASTSSGVAGSYVAVSPARILDTRCNANMNGQGCAGENLPAQNAGVGPLQAGSTATVQVTGVGGVPSTGVSAVVMDATVVSALGANAAASFLTLWPSGSSRPVASNLNWTPGEILSNRVIVPVSSSGEVDVYNYAGSINLVLDVVGWFHDSSPSTTSGAYFTPIDPVRLLDTRQSSPVGAGSSTQLQVTGTGVVPTGATAAVLDLVDLPTTPTTGNYLTAYPANLSSPPSTSDVNYSPGDPYDVVPNAVYATLSPAGSIQIYDGPPSGSAANVVVDCFGYFTQPSG